MVKYFQKNEKIGNFPTKLSNWKEMSIIEMTELPDTEKIRIVVRDEGYTEFDNRKSLDEEQTFNTYLLMQHRKSNMSIIGITQLDMMDIRWRGLEKFTILCKDRPIYDLKGGYYKGDFHYIFVKGGKYKFFTLPFSVAKKLFPLYKTEKKILPKDYEQIKMRIRMRNPKERKIIIDEMVQEIIKNVNVPTTKKAVTHDWLKNVLIELEKDLTLEPYIYIRLRNRIIE